MLGRKERSQLKFFITGSLRQLVPDDHVLVRVDRVLDLSWLRDEIGDCYCLDDGRPGIDPEAAVRRADQCRRGRRSAAANLSLIILFGDPRVEELYQARGNGAVIRGLLSSSMIYRKKIC